MSIKYYSYRPRADVKIICIGQLTRGMAAPTIIQSGRVPQSIGTSTSKPAADGMLFFVRSGRPANNYPLESGGFDYSDWGHYWSNQASTVVNDRISSYFLGFYTIAFSSRDSYRSYGLPLRCLAIE